MSELGDALRAFGHVLTTEDVDGARTAAGGGDTFNFDQFIAALKKVRGKKTCSHTHTHARPAHIGSGGSQRGPWCACSSLCACPPSVSFCRSLSLSPCVLGPPVRYQVQGKADFTIAALKLAFVQFDRKGNGFITEKDLKVCVPASERDRARLCVYVCMCVCVCPSLCVCVRARAFLCLVSVSVRECSCLCV
jgi:hypothetical protein